MTFGGKTKAEVAVILRALTGRGLVVIGEFTALAMRATCAWWGPADLAA